MVRTLADLNRNGNRGPNGPAGNPLGMGRMGRDFDWTTIPTGFYLVCLIQTVVFFLTALTGLGYLFANVPVLTVLALQLWRLFFCYLVINNIISLLVSYLVLFSLAMTEECENGSGRFLLQLFTRNLAVQLMVTVLGLLLYFVFGVMQIMSFGVWPVYFTYLTERCLENPEGITYFCMMPCPIKNKYYPLLLLGFFTLLGSGVGLPIDIWLGFGLAHLCARKPAIKALLEPSQACCQRVQRWLAPLDGKLGKLAPLSSEPAREGPLGGMPATSTAAGGSGEGRSTGEVVRQAFGGGGVRIGGTENNQVFTSYDHLEKPTGSQQANPFDAPNESQETASEGGYQKPQPVDPQAQRSDAKLDDSL